MLRREGAGGELASQRQAGDLRWAGGGGGGGARCGADCDGVQLRGGRGHTYFVGDAEEWGFDVWVHNAYNPDLLSQAARAPDKGLLTKAGRSFDKHAQRTGSTFEGLATGSPRQKNETAQEIVDYILSHPQATDVQRLHPRFGQIIEVTEPSGLGVRYSITGDFLHFLGL